MVSMAQIVARGRAFAAPLRAWSLRHRRVIVPVAAVVFAGALIWAVRDLGLTWADIHIGWLLVAFFGLAPLVVVINGWGIALGAWSFGKALSLRRATVIGAAGIVGELSPAPGVMAAHAGAMLGSGVGVSATAIYMAGRAAFFIGGAICVAALTLGAVPGWIAGGSGAVALGGFAALVRVCGGTQALVVVGQRALTLALQTGRIYVIFQVIGQGIALSSAPLFVASGMVGSIVFFVPAGLGASEALAALVAPLADVVPAAGFAAMALSRLMVLFWSMVVSVAALGLGKATK